LESMTLLVMIVSLGLMLIIPVLPGQFIIWLAALVYGVMGGWESMGGGVFALLTVGMIAAAAIDFVAGWVGAQRGGASRKAIIIGLGVGLVGLIVFNAFGALVGVMLGLVGYEYSVDRDLRRAMKAGGGYLLGLLVSLIVRFLIAVGMVFAFASAVM